MPSDTGNIVWFEIPVTDFERAKKFYGALFNWEFTRFDQFSQDYWEISTGDSDIGGLVKKVEHTSGDTGPIFYVHVNDINETLEKAKGLGARIVKQKTVIAESMGYFAHFLDADTNMIAIWSQH